MRKGFCITSEDTTDNFVGIRFRDGNPEVVFPRGYNIPADEKERRRDVFRLIGVLQRFANQKEGGKPNGNAEIISNFPIMAYQTIIIDFLSNGYYVEKEYEYVSGKNGRVNWKRTIQKENVWLNDSGAVFLDFQIRRKKNNDSNLITHIHRYCVYESFKLFGWLYFSQDYLPEKPRIEYNQRLFTSVLNKELSHTNNDAKKTLFSSMLKIINNTPEDISYRNSAIGVNHFAGIWESLINYVFGEEDISRYFPHAEWHILENGKFITSSALEPDTIMKLNGKIYILDAKYYQYGVTWASGDLPNTSSIQKQITYGKHVHSMGEVSPDNIYNAFVMPYNCAEASDNKEYVLKFVAVGSAGWEEYKNVKDIYNYSYILGILLDTRHLITTFSRHNLEEIEHLANVIEDSIETYKKAYIESVKTDG